MIEQNNIRADTPKNFCLFHLKPRPDCGCDQATEYSRLQARLILVEGQRDKMRAALKKIIPISEQYVIRGSEIADICKAALEGQP